VDLTIETQISNDLLVKRYNEARLVVYSPIREPLGLVPLEAIACGTPVVGVAEGGVCETILDGVTGRLVKRDPQMFAEAICELLDHPNTASEMGRQGREWTIQNWKWERSIADTEKIFQEVASLPGCQ
jgi:glycosyltransferase involved in cell wall biosynthesis